MAKIQQNFSLSAGDDIIISLDVNPDVESLVGTNITMRVYDQEFAVPIGDPVITKDIDNGLQISDPEYGIVLIQFDSADTMELTPKNYVYEITMYDTEGKRITVTEGVLTLNRTVNPQTFP